LRLEHIRLSQREVVSGMTW